MSLFVDDERRGDLLAGARGRFADGLQLDGDLDGERLKEERVTGEFGDHQAQRASSWALNSAKSARPKAWRLFSRKGLVSSSVP